ncbi:polysialyltransferase family glycosyltransferase [Mesonia ostreae]|uniref:Polysialyltransferase family glycosyltransferase n=1 Tax=Mesonia ostreae TaxID=861110 RepID=A0ABU2KH81_9FLAO|nr:polysialyltransferase family glycosyltransferase [Mesonia ostreae]MDT0294067.1 polysialyltransferase family glycosyltransferase [Mesonia ostreae]
MKISRNVFLAHTEYHLMQSLNIAFNNYSSQENQNTVYFVKNNTRLSNFSVDDTRTYGNVDLIILEDSTSKEYVEKILSLNVHRFIFFQAISIFNIYLCHLLKKRGAEISLGPDGYVSYVIYKKKHEFLSMLKDSFSNYKKLFREGLFLRKFYKIRYYRYGSYSFIDNLWLSHPEQYTHTTSNKVNLLKLPTFTKETIKTLEKIFHFQFDMETQNVIYYFNQPFWTEKLIDREMRFLKDTLEAFKDNMMFIKLHPLTPQTTIDLYKEFPRVSIISSKAPAELILVKLKNCIVFSGWSTVLLTENKKCNYYFNYPIYKNCDAKAIDQSNFIDLDHINIITSPGQMQFPNE